MSFLPFRRPLFGLAASGLLVFASLGAAACGQEGVVSSTTSGTTTSDSGGAGGTGGTGSGGSTSIGGAETAMPLKVVTWNLHNFFDTKKDTSAPEEKVPTQGEFNSKVTKVGTILAELDADIAILPEVENVGVLDALNSTKLGGAYLTKLTDSNDFRGLDIGILSKVPLDSVVSHVGDMFKRLDLVGGQSYKYSRDAVEIHITFNTRKIVLLGVHYRSKGTGMAETDDKDKRMAEAQHTRAIADAIQLAEPKTAIVILGDFNDLPGSPPLNWSEQGDAMNKPKIEYADAADFIAEGERYTFVYNGVKELIDHQMMNPLLQQMVDGPKVTIRHGNDVEDASDHFPLMATYHIQ